MATQSAFDVAILGSGFGGALLAMAARQQGRSVLVLERGTHPRFAIGESTSPLTNLLLEELAREYRLPRLLPLTRFGDWKRAYPEIPVGLKRGFTFYQHQEGKPFTPRPDRENELLVAASPNDEVADTHWYREAFDHFLIREAQSLGAIYVDHVCLDRYQRSAHLTTLEGTRQGKEVRYQARFVVDATGPRGALSRLLNLPEQPLPDFPATQALFSHFTGVARFHPSPAATPYPPDDAALHHVFEGGWMWVLRFDNGITSAGFAVEDRLAAELRLEEKEGAWERFLARFPSIREQFRGAEAVQPFFHYPRLSYGCGALTGEGWALLPSAAAFVDPLFSTGFPLTLLGIHRLARALRSLHHPPEFNNALAAYAALTRREAEAAATLVGACYRSFSRFPSFAALSMLYFAAASYSEMARRLDRPHLANQFLLQNQPGFRAAFQHHCAAARRGAAVSLPAIAADLDPYNIAGLCDPAKGNWYGVDLQDVVRGAARLECTPEEVEAFFQRMGWE